MDIMCGVFFKIVCIYCAYIPPTKAHDDTKKKRSFFLFHHSPNDDGHGSADITRGVTSRE